MACVIPPVGQNRAMPNGAAMAFKAGMPPLASAGKNLNRSSPRSSPRMMSAEVAIPGRNATLPAIAALARLSVSPGETMNSLPAASASSSACSLSTVPAPTIAPGTCFISRITANALAVRNVTSSTGNPPATSARAIGTACATSSITSTGMTGAIRMISSIRVIAGVPWRKRLRRRTGRAGDG